MSLFPLKSNSVHLKRYYVALTRFEEHGHTTEGNTRSAFADLLKRCAGAYDWHLVEEYRFKGTGKQPLRADGAHRPRFFKKAVLLLNRSEAGTVGVLPVSTSEQDQARLAIAQTSL